MLATKKLEEFEFFHTLTINSDMFVVEDSLRHYKQDGGVYLVYYNGELWYIGCYSISFQERWVNKIKNKNCVNQHRHFKYLELQEMAQSGSVEVYSISNEEIRKITGCKWVNQASVEIELIKIFNPPMNTSHKHK